MQAERRPWLFSTTPKIVGQGLHYDIHGANIELLFELTNSGKGPAVNAHLEALPYPRERARPPLAEQKKICGEARNKPYNPLSTGVAIFPNQIIPSAQTYSVVNKQALEKLKLLSITIVGCIDYMFTDDLETHHQTGFIYDALRKKPDTPGLFAVDPKDGDIPASELKIRSVLENGAFYAD